MRVCDQTAYAVCPLKRAYYSRVVWDQAKMRLKVGFRPMDRFCAPPVEEAKESREDRSERLWQVEARQLREDRSRRKEKQQLLYSKQHQEEVRIMVEECSMHPLQKKRRRAS
jgi:hypothetical protein